MNDFLQRVAEKYPDIVRTSSAKSVVVDVAPGQEDDVILDYLSSGESYAVPLEVTITLSGRDLSRVLGVQERVLLRHLDKKEKGRVPYISDRDLDRVYQAREREIFLGAKAVGRQYPGVKKVSVGGVADSPYLAVSRIRPDALQITFEIDSILSP